MNVAITPQTLANGAPAVLTHRWYPLRATPEPIAYVNSTARFNVVPAGRRSGKTERLKRKLVKAAMRGNKNGDARFFAAAPTWQQAKNIFWRDLKLLMPPRFLASRPSESELTIRTITGSELVVFGMDKPERIEGQPWDGGGLDEYGNMKAKAWGANVRPALSDRLGWCDLIGVPEGRNHYYDLYKQARADTTGEWAAFTWKSSDVLPASEIEAARRDLDELTFQQEYEASFINFEGRVYYPFNENLHCARLHYDPDETLILCFDFNVAPGIAGIAQEQRFSDKSYGTGIIGEVWIPQNSNTLKVCDKIIQDWGGHRGRVKCYGDASGGARGSAKVEGSDWDLIETKLKPIFGDRLSFIVPEANPRERARVNAVNTRLLNGAGDIRMKVDPSRAPHIVKDFEGVVMLEGGSGEIDKKKTPQLTHLSDAIGYYIVEEFPVIKQNSGAMEIRGF